MSGAEWVAEKINGGGIDATVQSDNIIFLERANKPDAYVGVVSTPRGDASPVVSLDDAKAVYGQNSKIAMMIAIPRAARWSGAAMRWLQENRVAWGGVGDLMSAMTYDDDMRVHRNKTWAFVADGLPRHSRVADLEWIDSKFVRVHLRNGSNVTVVLEDAYDITMNVARQAARTFGNFDVLLKTNPNGSITSNGAEAVERLGFQTLKWGELFGHLAKRGG